VAGPVYAPSAATMAGFQPDALGAFITRSPEN
jgi:hypothetical protein